VEGQVVVGGQVLFPVFVEVLIPLPDGALFDL
jgi:hypothetical protein